jgi:K+-sensing histidine kinase KdpD
LRDCISDNLSERHFKCAKGFSCYVLCFNNKYVVINGVIGPQTRMNFTGERWKIYKQYRIDEQEIEAIQTALNSINAYTVRLSERQVKDSVSFLHDIRTGTGIVLSWCQELISKQPGSSFEEKLAYADSTTLNLLQSINLLSEQLNLIDIIANPTAITYGKKYKSKLHGFLFKMVKLFEPVAARRNINILLRGSSYADVCTYNSFQYLPLVLLDNAIKYSHKSKDIFVTINENDSEVIIIVSSFGRIVPKEYRESIFNKYVRGPNASTENPHGMGMGLYLARLIAQAHQSNVHYRSIPDDGDIGYNEFIVTLEKSI